MHPTPARRRRRRPSRPGRPSWDGNRLTVEPEPSHVEDFAELGTRRPRAAGHVLLVMLVALAVGALLDADRMAERAEQKSFDDPWRDVSVTVWGGVESVADALWLDRPRQALESALGREGTGREQLDVADLLPGRSAPDRDATTPTGSVEASTTTTEAPLAEPHIRTPNAEAPLRLYVGGDSVAKNFGIAMQSAAGSTGIIASQIDYRLVSGLTRPDFFNWPQHLADDIVPTDPEVVILLFGANDAQSIRRNDGSICTRFEQCWIDEYRRRVAGTMDLLRDPENDRIVLWLGQPIMGPGSGVLYVDLFNSIYAEEASTRPWVRYVDTWSWFSRPDGSYSAYLRAADGTEHRVREPDDVHLTLDGGARLSWALLRLIANDVADLSAWSGTPPADQAPGDEPPPRGPRPPAEPVVVD